MFADLEIQTMDDALLTCNRGTLDRIRAIVKRLHKDLPTMEFDGLSLSMDLTVCHNLGHVDLDRLRDAALGDFAHDLSGIHNHMDRKTGELTDCFVPRCHNLEKH